MIPDASPSPLVLVTGSTGFLGSRLVKALIERGYRVRALARKTSRTEHLRNLDLEITYGDVAHISSLDAAFTGVNFVVHAAADTRGTAEGVHATVAGTRNVVMLSKKHSIERLIYISSCSVYGVSQLKAGQIADENAPLELQPEQRGFYSEAKLKAEKLLFEYAGREAVPFICLRPGTIFGEGGATFTPDIGFRLNNGFFLVIGDRRSLLSLVYVDNLIEAIVRALEAPCNSSGTIYNVVNPDRISKKKYVDLLLRRLHPNAKFFYVPYPLLYALIWLQESIFAKLTRRRPFLTRYRLISSQRSILYNSLKIQRELNWLPTVTLNNAISRVLRYELQRATPIL